MFTMSFTEQITKQLISVIVPVYNAEKYLNDCLRSIAKQTYGNFEVILINDGSSDKSESICLNFCKLDSRFNYYCQQNSGVSAARNNGIDIASGVFITFIDSDDFWEPKYLEILYNTIISDNYDLVCASFRSVYKNGRHISSKLPRYIINSADELIAICYQTNMTIILGSCWGKLYRTSLVKQNSIVFPVNLKYYEDNIYNLQIFSKIKSAILIPDVVYNYRINNDSVSHKFTFKDLEDLLFMLKCRQEYFCRLNNFNIINFANFSIVSIFSSIRMILKSQPTYHKKVLIVNSILSNESVVEYIDNSRLQPKDSIKTHISIFIMQTKSAQIICLLSTMINVVTKILHK